MDAAERIFREARELIEIESPSGAEGPCVDRAEALLRDSGLRVESIPVGPGRRNLLAGPPNAPVLLATHLDCVPPYVPYSEDAEHLRGRGSCDAKGIAAAMLGAARRLLSSGETRFGVLFLVGEEVDNAGARAANRVVRSRHLIMGEPTRNLLARGHKGALLLRLEARGVAAHSAYPDRGRSAIHRLLDALERLRAADLGTDPVLGPSTLNVGRIGGGAAANVLAPDAWAEVMLRVVLPLEETEARVAAATRRADDISIRTITRMPPTFTETLEGFPSTVVAFGTDIPFLRDVGRPYLIGPGDILDAHTADEKISRRELLDAVDLYERLVLQLL